MDNELKIELTTRKAPSLVPAKSKRPPVYDLHHGPAMETHLLVPRSYYCTLRTRNYPERWLGVVLISMLPCSKMMVNQYGVHPFVTIIISA